MAGWRTPASGPAHGRSRRPRLAAAVVSIRARRCSGPGPKTGSASTRWRATRRDCRRRRRDRTGERAGFQPWLFFGQPRSDVAHGTWYFDGMPHRVLITDRLRMPPAGAPDRRTRKGRRDQHAVRPDAGRHLALSHDRHAPGCPGIGSGTTWRRRPWARRWRRSRRSRTCMKPPAPDRQRAQALPGHAGVLPARARRGGTGPARPGPGERDAQRWFAAGARGRRGGAAQQLPALAAAATTPAGSAPVVHPLMFAQHAANLSPVWGRAQGYGAPRHHDVQLRRRRADHLRSAQPPGPADERPPVPVRPDGSANRPRSTTS